MGWFQKACIVDLSPSPKGTFESHPYVFLHLKDNCLESGIFVTFSLKMGLVFNTFEKYLFS
jgi:hypothetical protein